MEMMFKIRYYIGYLIYKQLTRFRENKKVNFQNLSYFDSFNKNCLL